MILNLFASVESKIIVIDSLLLNVTNRRILLVSEVELLIENGDIGLLRRQMIVLA